MTGFGVGHEASAGFVGVPQRQHERPSTSHPELVLQFLEWVCTHTPSSGSGFPVRSSGVVGWFGSTMKLCSGSKEGSYLRLMNLCIIQL